MLAPRSYTREDVVELQCHGNDLCLRRVLRACLEAGARLADPGKLLAAYHSHCSRASPFSQSVSQRERKREGVRSTVSRILSCWDQMTSEGHALYCCLPLMNLHQFCIFFIGEFTLRAFLNGRLDLAQAENVSRLISAKSAAAADSALAGIQVFYKAWIVGTITFFLL